jgi:PPOX class probable F420-dependent enzyme
MAKKRAATKPKAKTVRAEVQTAEPKAERPSFAKGYGIGTGPNGMREWKEVTAKLAKAHTYWLGTVRPDGRPHVMPVWGVWMDGAVYFGTDRESQKGRNLRANPAVTVHLDGEYAVIVEGRARQVSDAGVIARLDKDYAKKYGMKLTSAPGELFVVAVEPAKIFAFREKDFPKSATRWRFGRAAAAGESGAGE